MKKVKLFVCGDMTAIDIGRNDLFKIFNSNDYYSVIANVTDIKDKGDCCTVETDFCNPHRSVCSVFLLTKENFNKIKWIE